MFRLGSRARLPAALWLLSASVFAADAKPIARVGSSTLSAEGLTRRLAMMPDFQRAALGGPDVVKRRVLETELIPELLYAEEAARQKLDERPAVRARTREILREALERELRKESATQSPVSPDDIHAYFEANRSRFETPRRLRIWRILTDDEALAKRIIAESKGVDGIQRWTKFARENSLDKATHLRNGDLGFVHPDGNTDTPTLRVDPVLFAIADKLTDGELAAQPIKEGLHFAVLWRRGSMKAVSRTLAQESGSIRQVLERQRLERVRGELLGRLQGAYVSGKNEALLESFQFNAEGIPTRTLAPLPAGSSAPVASALPPTPGPRGER